VVGIEPTHRYYFDYSTTQHTKELIIMKLFTVRKNTDNKYELVSKKTQAIKAVYNSEKEALTRMHQLEYFIGKKRTNNSSGRVST